MRINLTSVPVDDQEKALRFYTETLGFQKEWEWGEPVDYACVSRGDVRVFLCQDGQGGPGMWISVFIDDVDALHAEYEKRGAIIRQAPTSFPWGVREMNVEDLDGHRLRMGSNPTGAADDEPLNEAP